MSKQVEYRVRPVTRYVVTRWEQDVEAGIQGSTQEGEFENEAIALNVAEARCAIEQRRSDGTVNFVYPTRPTTA